MDLDYQLIGKRIARRRKELELTQAVTEERAGMGQKYLSNIENAYSIPSVEVVVNLAIALETTPDEFLVGAVKYAEDDEEKWRGIAELLRGMDDKQLDMARCFLVWLSGQKL